MEKLDDYTGGYWRMQVVKDAWREWRDKKNTEVVDDSQSGSGSRSLIGKLRDNIIIGAHKEENRDFSHVTRKKSRAELLLISAAVMGIEFCYAAETAFVSPTLLSIGVEHSHMTLIWCLSPLVGFFLTPILGSMSDRCRSRLGRRRPFILLLSVGIILGLILVPNGKLFGEYFGDWGGDIANNSDLSSFSKRSFHQSTNQPPSDSQQLKSIFSNQVFKNFSYPIKDTEGFVQATQYRPWGIFFTIIGTMLLDFSSDACQSPSRSFLLDITIPDDHAKGLSTFTIMAGLGGAFGYMMGGTNWDSTWVGQVLGGHVRAVFSLVLVIYLVCLAFTLTSFAEVPLPLIEQGMPTKRLADEDETMLTSELAAEPVRSYGALSDESGFGATTQQPSQTSFTHTNNTEPAEEEKTQLETKSSLRKYLMSILVMPNSLRVLCLTNLFCWMSLVCYSLYFTDFVGEAVFGGDPQAVVGSESQQRYEQGVRFGCWGLAVYSLSCSLYSFLIERLVRKFRAKPVYVGGQLAYSIGMVFMAALRHPAAVIVFSLCAGIMYSTLFTMPYLLVAHYHVNGVFEENGESVCGSGQVRGLGTDVAIVSSMVFLAQFVLSICLGSVISAAGTTTMVVVMASVLSFCGAVSATQVTYLNL